jgi:hypothetical protein
MDLNIEGLGEVSGWFPPITDHIETPGFTATKNALYEVFGSKLLPNSKVHQTRKFIDILFQKGYIIAKYDGDE